MGQEVKNLIRAQSKYGLMGSSAKTGKKIFYGSQEQFLDKTFIWDRTPPTIYQMQCICVGEGSRVPNLQTEFNYLDSFKSYGIFRDFVVPVVPALSLSSPHHPHVVPIVPRRSPCGPRCPLHPRHPRCLHPCCPRCPHVVPIVPTSSPLCLEGPQIIPNPPDSHPTHPPPSWGVGGLESLKMQ